MENCGRDSYILEKCYYFAVFAAFLLTPAYVMDNSLSNWVLWAFHAERSMNQLCRGYQFHASAESEDMLFTNLTVAGNARVVRFGKLGPRLVQFPSVGTRKPRPRDVPSCTQVFSAVGTAVVFPLDRVFAR